jgi:hypothetical protein
VDRIIQEGRPEERNLNDAAALQAKVAAKQAQKEAELANGGAGSNAPFARKVKDKKQEELDELLNAGLGSGKKKGVKA